MNNIYILNIKTGDNNKKSKPKNKRKFKDNKTKIASKTYKTTLDVFIDNITSDLFYEINREETLNLY